MARSKAPKPSDLQHALGAALAASKLYAETLDKLITCADKNTFTDATALLKTGHEQMLAIKDAHNNLYVPVSAAVKAAAPVKEPKAPKEPKNQKESEAADAPKEDKPKAVGKPSDKERHAARRAVSRAGGKVSEASSDEP